MMTAKKWRWIGIGASWPLLIVVLIRLNVVPTRTFPDKNWFSDTERGRELSASDPVISRMIARARIDHFIAPTDRRYRVIGFHRAWITKPDDVYISFVSSVSDVSVVYRGDRQSGALFWKAVSFESP